MKNDNEQIQKIKMCITTYFNLNGVMPSIQEMLDWLGASFKDILTQESINRLAAPGTV